MSIINLLWTGGLDSTFRLCQLSHYDVTVQPYYVMEQRKSMKYEIRAMEKIRNILKQKCHPDFHLLPTVYIEREQIALDSELTKSWNNLHNKYVLGSQYEYLARYAKQHKIKLEIGLEKSPRGKATLALSKESQLSSRNYLNISDLELGGVSRSRLF
jgi:7-cyano-7-deazaguanine synthase